MVKLELVTDMKALMAEVEKKANEEILKKLIQAGDLAIDKIRKKMGRQPYQDQTGDLRSSTGFIIYHEGKIMYKNFKVHSGGSGTEKEKEKAAELGLRLANAEYRSRLGWGIVVVSGMEYASWVQSKGFDVLSSTQNNMSGKHLKDALKEIGLIAT